MTDSDDALLPLDAVRPAVVPSKGAPVPAPDLPVARVAVDNPLPHLDRPFDYLVPASMHESAQPGVRVRVRFAGKLVDGFLLERAGRSEHTGALTALERVVSPERVLTPEIAGLARAVADRYAGTLADVLRLAVPPRHAKAEAETPVPAPRSSGGSGTPASGSSDVSETPASGSSDVPETPASGLSDVPQIAAPGSSEAPEIAAPGSPAGSEAAASRPSSVSEGPAPGASAVPETPAPASSGVPETEAGPWASYPDGASFLAALRDGRAPRAVWQALPGARGWAPEIAHAVRATLHGGRSAVVVVPDGRDVALADAALSEALEPGDHVALTADLGPAERYRRWLRLLRGQARAVVGTRAAMFAPVADLGLVAIWDDGDDLHAERLAPYPHAREVLALRAHRSGAAMLIGGHTRTAEATQLIAARWARPIVAARQTVRSLAPRVRPAGEDAELAKDQAARAARLPSLAWRALRQGLEQGPVLVQVPRRGYLPAVACQQCRAPARCAMPPTRLADRPAQLGVSGDAQLCHGPLALRAGHAAPFCRWCGRVDPGWRCPHCGGARLRAVVVGARRTAEELGRAFPSTPVRTSGRDGVLASVTAARALVVATPGAEPVAEGGYAAAVLLDAWSLLGRADLRASEEALRRWMNAAALLRPGAELVVLADAGLPAVQALLRWDPITHAERELADRAELGFPPAVRMATLTGASAAVRQMLDEVRLPAEAQVLGPVPIDEAGQERAMIRVPRPGGAVLAAALKGASGVRAARKAPDVVRVSVDPLDLI
ncbi:primosome assembly protein PriA [Nonomuraea roseoviolacea]|uniref:Probable replication restart protein PriA n=1 Tax=Nonomuraea roseoviolacea subsp. carminata TaxID=160689 RepID=A0ABT1JRH2_9ACTN|nr:primosome assembly protein PriA [Nonomuraea roseoviolacea]MCP2344341.1 primosomal protein N' (replication factor Y) [Nonomuraea roseoviolacea subsp. carminata]